jgi:hypothetical protein
VPGRIQPELLTEKGMPAVSGAVLRSLAGKPRAALKALQALVGPEAVAPLVASPGAVDIFEDEVAEVFAEVSGGGLAGWRWRCCVLHRVVLRGGGGVQEAGAWQLSRAGQPCASAALQPDMVNTAARNLCARASGQTMSCHMHGRSAWPGRSTRTALCSTCTSQRSTCGALRRCLVTLTPP